MMFALRQMMSLSLMMSLTLMIFGKHRIIANEMSNIIFAKQMHHIAAGDASFHLAPPPLLCYNILKVGDLMEVLFKNSFIKTEEWIKECNKYSFFRRPIFVAFHLLSILALCWGIYKLLFLHIIDISLLFLPIWWFFVVLMLYFITNKTTVKRNKEIYGDKAEVVSEVTKDSIKQIHSNGSQYQIYYDTIKKGYVTRNYILLHSKANILYTFSKKGFSIGNEEEFLKFLRNKGIKIK